MSGCYVGYLQEVKISNQHFALKQYFHYVPLSPPPPAIHTMCPNTNLLFEKEEQDPILFSDGTNTNNINISPTTCLSYTDLLHAITSLQTDLQGAKIISTKLAKDNQSLLQQNNSSTQESLELRERLELSKHALQSQI